MAVYGLVRRHTTKGTAQWFATLHSDTTSAYTTGSGGPPGADGQVNGAQYADADPIVSALTEWSSGGDAGTIADNTWFHFAVVPFLDGGVPKTRVAIRPAAGGTTLVTTQTGIFAWSNTRVQFGAGPGNGFGANMLLAKLIVRNVSEPSTAQIEAVWSTMAMTGATVHASLDCIGAASVAACLEDQSGNDRDFVLSGANHTVDNASDPTFNPTITGTAVMPSTSAATVPLAPSGLAATVASASSVTLTYADNSSNETEFVAEIREWTGSIWSAWTVAATVGAGVSTIVVGGLTPSVQYEARVRAGNSAGSSAFTNVVSFTTRQRYVVSSKINASAAGVTGCTVQVWRQPVNAPDVVGEPLFSLSNRSFEAATVVDPADSVSKAVMKVPMPALGQLIPPTPGTALCMYITKPGSPKRFTDIITDAVVVEE